MAYENLPTPPDILRDKGLGHAATYKVKDAGKDPYQESPTIRTTRAITQVPTAPGILVSEVPGYSGMTKRHMLSPTNRFVHFTNVRIVQYSCPIRTIIYDGRRAQYDVPPNTLVEVMCKPRRHLIVEIVPDYMVRPSHQLHPGPTPAVFPGPVTIPGPWIPMTHETFLTRGDAYIQANIAGPGTPVAKLQWGDEFNPNLYFQDACNAIGLATGMNVLLRPNTAVDLFMLYPQASLEHGLVRLVLSVAAGDVLTIERSVLYPGPLRCSENPCAIEPHQIGMYPSWPLYAYSDGQEDIRDTI